MSKPKKTKKTKQSTPKPQIEALKKTINGLTQDIEYSNRKAAEAISMLASDVELVRVLIGNAQHAVALGEYDIETCTEDLAFAKGGRATKSDINYYERDLKQSRETLKHNKQIAQSLEKVLSLMEKEKT